MPGKFIVKKGSTGKFRFNLLSTNGKVVASGEAYNTKASAMGGISSVKNLAGDADIEEQTTKEWADVEPVRKAAAKAKSAKKAAAKGGRQEGGGREEGRRLQNLINTGGLGPSGPRSGVAGRR